MAKFSRQAQALAIVGGALLAQPAMAGVVNVPWAGANPQATNTNRSPAPNVANVIKFLGILGTAEFFAGEGGIGNVYATVGATEYLLISMSPGEGATAPLAGALEQAMVGTLTNIRLEAIEGPENGPLDQFRALQLADGEIPTIFQFETADENTAIPEPVSVLTFLFGLAGLGWAARRRQLEPVGVSV